MGMLPLFSLPQLIAHFSWKHELANSSSSNKVAWDSRDWLRFFIKGNYLYFSIYQINTNTFIKTNKWKQNIWKTRKNYIFHLYHSPPFRQNDEKKFATINYPKYASLWNNRTSNTMILYETIKRLKATASNGING